MHKIKNNLKSNTIPNTTDEPFFSTEQSDKLFSAVLVHDDIHLDVKLPNIIHLDYSQQQLHQCYLICLQIWQQGVKRESLSRMIKNIYHQHDLSPEDKLAYKYMRAKFKHLRFAYITCDERHRYPMVFHRMTILMGSLQDVLKNNKNSVIGPLAILLRILLSKFFFALIVKEIKRFQSSTPESFREYVNNEIHFIRLNLAKEKITSKTFHEMRKVISRQVALYDNLKILYPSSYHCSISHYLSTINGMMGGMHDELIVRKFETRRDYYANDFEIPDEIRQRLTTLTEKYKNPNQSCQ